MKNPHIDLKKQNDQTIKMQKAQSFIQPGEFSYTGARRRRNNINKYEIPQHKDCDGELIERTILSIKKKQKNEYDNLKTNMNKNFSKVRKADSDLSIITIPELNKNNISNDNYNNNFLKYKNKL